MKHNLAQKLSDGFLELVGYVIALRTVIFGLSFLLRTPEAQHSLLWKHIERFPNLEPEIFGAVFSAVGLFAFVGWLLKSKIVVKYSSQIQFLVWAFSCALYCFNGSWFTAAITTVPWLIFTFATSYLYVKRPNRVNYELLRRELGLDDDGR